MALPDFAEHEVLKRARGLIAPPYWAWLPEAAAGAIGLVALNILFWGDDPGFRSSPFNPFLALTILMALRYGGSAGFGAGLLGAGAWLSVVGSLRHVAIGPEILETEYVWMPALLVLTGLLVGAFVQPLHGRAAFYRKLAEERDREMELSKLALDRLQRRVERQESAPASGSADLLDRVKAMRSESEDRICRMLLDLLGEDFGVEAAVYLSRDRRLELAAFQGNAWARRPADRLGEGGLAGLALERGRVVTALELRDARSEPFLLCGPLKGPGGEKLGVVGIQRIAFRQMNGPMLQRLSALLDWTGSCLAHARRQATSSGGNGDGDGRFAFDRSFLNLFLDSRGERDGAGCELLLACIGQYDSLPPDRREAVRQAAVHILLRAIRSNDFICESGQPDTFVIVTDPVAPASNGYKDAVFNRVRRARAEAVAAEQDVPEHILVGAVVVRPGDASLDQLIAEAEWHLLPEAVKET